MRIRHVALVFALALSACTSAAPPTSETPPATVGADAVASAELPQPYDERSPAGLLNDHPIRSDAPNPEDLRTLRARAIPFSSVHHTGDHEDAGIGFDETGSRYTSLYVVHTLYPQFMLSYPSGQTGTEWLFAPTTKAGCLENVTVYLNHGYGTQEEFAVYDWCNTISYILSKSIDATFVQNYVRTLANGRTAYVTEIHASSHQPTVGTVWRSLIYNHRTLRWDTMVSLVQQKPPTYNGWSIFETYFLIGPCPKTPAISASSIKLYDTVTQTWRLLTTTLPSISESSSSGPPGECFVADSTGPATYTFSDTPYYSWTVR